MRWVQRSKCPQRCLPAAGWASHTAGQPLTTTPPARRPLCCCTRPQHGLLPQFGRGRGGSQLPERPKLGAPCWTGLPATSGPASTRPLQARQPGNFWKAGSAADAWAGHRAQHSARQKAHYLAGSQPPVDHYAQEPCWHTHTVLPCPAPNPHSPGTLAAGPPGRCWGSAREDSGCTEQRQGGPGAEAFRTSRLTKRPCSA